MITVYNLHEDPKWEGPSVKIMRPGVLGNPWAVYQDGTRAQVIERYREWLWVIVRKGSVGAWERAALERGSSREELTAQVKECLRLKQIEDERWQGAVWVELQGLVARERAGETINLVCCCKPLACHGDVLKSCVEWLSLRSKIQDPNSKSQTEDLKRQGALL